MSKISVGKLTAKDAISALKSKKHAVPGMVVTASELYNPYKLRRPSGILSLDLATAGGLPAGGLSQIHGPDSTGKNFLVYHYIAQCQKIYGEDAAIVVACFEPTLDKNFAREAGVQLAYSKREIAEMQQNRKENKAPPLTKAEVSKMQKQVGEFVILRGLPETVFEDLLFLLRTNKFQIIAVDSWDAMLPDKEKDKDLSSSVDSAAASKLESRFMRKLWATLNTTTDNQENETTVIGIRQVRANRSQFGKDWIFKGSHAMRHGKLIDIELSNHGKIKENDTIIGKRIGWRLVKAKMGCHEGPSDEYRFIYTPPRIDVLDDLITLGMQHGIITKTGSWFLYDKLKRQGRDSFREAIHIASLGNEIYKKLIKHLNVEFKWR